MKIYIANAEPRRVAEIAQRTGLSGTVYPAYGFGKWGVERTAVVEIGGFPYEEKVIPLVAELLAAYPNEQAVYFDPGYGRPTTSASGQSATDYSRMPREITRRQVGLK